MRGRPNSNRPSRELVERLIREAVSATGISRDDLVGYSTSKFVAPGRRHVWRALTDLGYSATAVADAWGCDPSTVWTALRGKKRPIRSRDLKAPLKADAQALLTAWPAIEAKLSERARPARS